MQKITCITVCSGCGSLFNNGDLTLLCPGCGHPMVKGMAADIVADAITDSEVTDILLRSSLEQSIYDVLAEEGFEYHPEISGVRRLVREQ